MMKLPVPILLALAAAPMAHAHEVRQLDAHEHGVGHLDIAIDGTTVALSLEAPGADIVGFEYVAETEADNALVDTALADLESPLTLVDLPEAAGCAPVAAKAELVTEDVEHSGDDHGHDHDHDHDHDTADAGHSEFRAEYTLTCADPAAIDRIAFPYFERFPNALELEVQVVTPNGASAFEVGRDAPSIDLGGLI